MEKNSRILLVILTVLYAAVSLLGLGTTRFPQSYYTFDNYDSAIVDFGEVKDVGAVWINGNIAVGRLLLYSDDGNIFEYSQQYGEMFSWRIKELSFRTRFITLKLNSGTVSINELAFFNTTGERINVFIAPDSPAGAERLFDEQDTVPSAPDYKNGMYFDEIYHARTAYEFIHGLSAYEWTHPPLGKELIALGILVFGMTPFGWRVMPALFGAAMIPLMYLLGKRMFHRSDYALLASLLLALDTLHFAQTRIATVDVFVVFFILLMFLFMMEFLQKDFLKDSLLHVFFPLGMSGICFGLGTASKWTGLYAGLGLAVIFFSHLIIIGVMAHKDQIHFREFCVRLIQTLMFCIVFFVILPGCIYFLSYLPFFRYEASIQPGSSYRLFDAWHTLVQQQQSMFGYHSGLTATHPCQSVWYEWLLSSRGVWFYFSSIPPNARISNITSIGNPAVWWGSTAGMICMILLFSFERPKGDDRKTFWFLLISILANLLPWTLVTRCTFLYHYFPTLPFAILAAVFLISFMEKKEELPSWLKWIWALVSLLFFILMYPAVSGMAVSVKYARFLEYILPTGTIYFGAV